MNKAFLSLAVTTALYATVGAGFAQDAAGTDAGQRTSVTTTSNTTNSNATQRARQLDAVNVTGNSLSLGGGNMQVQYAPKAVSTIGREAILKAAPGANFTQMLSSIPGALSASNDVSGLNDGNFTVRGFPADEVGVTVNGVPINDSGDYTIYATEYGDTENMGDITVEQGYPGVTSPVIGAAGGNIAWVTVDPTAEAGLDLRQSFGSNRYKRTFLRYNTGDTGPVRSWVSYSNNQADQWRGDGQSTVTKIDAKSEWTLDEGDAITGSVQYNRKVTNNYRNLTKAQIAANGYDFGYVAAYKSDNPSDWVGTRVNPFRSWTASLDGEFTLSDSLHLSVVPYFVYGYGGGGYGYAKTYVFYTFDTFRPGLHVKFKQDFGMNDSLEYGVLAERPREQSANVFLPADPQGNPADVWGHDSRYYYKNPNGSPQVAYRLYSTTPTYRVFATNTWTPNDQWMLTVGGAYTWVRRKGWYATWPGADRGIDLTTPDNSTLYASGAGTYKKFTPTAGVKFQLDEQNQFFLGVGKAYRAPINTSALYDFWNAAYADAIGSQPSIRDAAPEQSLTADLGWRYYGDKLSTVLDLYATNFAHKQFSGADPVTRAPVYYQLGSVQMRGVNTELSYKVDDLWSLYASYAYNKSEMKRNVALGGTLYATDGKTLVNAPKNVGYVALNVTGRALWASLSVNAQSRIWGTFLNDGGSDAGGSATVNLNGGYNFQDFGGLKKPYLKVNVFNLGNRKALMYAATTALDTTAAAAAWQPLQDRTLMVTLGGSFAL
ncbi:TonB-dependent receptor [Xanthomonas translucens]|uniref:TonB-dependent receptor n=1 Tax=Xanthomonas campestris pv. translucens TaxID=343 RepID=UPI00071E7D83|nr:TonB-dependent receptor [Xanthomonas translucens]KTF40907.1 TonB-dependent receptor [Xanthomonas translucens pv. translucens]KWV16781.1 TonB-dependent receptor [Xanthomonas translucens]MCT8272870.1 TonB-dependent receptor [Xanthomonas translucens pv. translucens]MCT8276903.1 TonB-dependent receptor [Xanthomonas translucens pv. translucens]MCT8305805.1 TonB-dependent receptor [Xanthomonas translucens pv. translucens]